MNINEISNNYVKGNSPKNEEQKDKIPAEYKGLSSNQLECNIKRLENDMNAELMTIKLRYENKINSMKDALKLIKLKE